MIPVAIQIYCGDRLVWAYLSPQCFVCQCCGKCIPPSKVVW